MITPHWVKDISKEFGSRARLSGLFIQVLGVPACALKRSMLIRVDDLGKILTVRLYHTPKKIIVREVNTVLTHESTYG